ncbi:MAG: IgA Peptidase M64 [Bacteroidales bacterium]|nr:IgA Peptidase M64 [Bacteroidales bacterium]
MKRVFFTISFFFIALSAYAQQRTLRIDYIFSGNSRETFIAVDELRILEGWAGRRQHLSELPLRGNGCLTIRSASDSSTLYRTSFSTLFQEWQHTEEATRTSRSFENVFLVPMPESPVLATIELFDSHGNTSAISTHPIDPSDILLRPASSTPATRDIHIGGPVEDCIDVAIVAEGYTAAELETFWKDAKAAVDAILSHEPFGSLRDRFNFRAVGLVSRDSGVSEPAKGLWKDTALHSSFSTFYTDRYLTTLRIKDLHDALASVPYEHIIILANTDSYGGGGIYNSYTLTTAHHKKFRPVVAHEFGHSFAGLADEYFYDDQFESYYPADFEPWEQNITTMVDFSSKWEGMLGTKGVSVFEGGGYQSKGVWRGCDNCRMKTNEAPSFCPVCQRAIERIILFYSK